MLTAIGPGAKGVIHPCAISAGESTAMGEEDLEARVSRHDPVENQIMDRNSGIERVADDVGQIVFAKSGRRK